MPFDSMNFTNKAYEAAPRLASVDGLDKLYSDTVPQDDQKQFEILVGHIESIAHEVQFEMSTSLETFKNIFNLPAWKGCTHDIYNDLKTSLEHSVLALIEGKENNKIHFVKNLLKLLSKEFLQCSSGTPFREGNYFYDASQKVSANLYYAFSTPGLIDCLQHAPELAYVYEGSVVDLCCAYPPNKLGRFNYKRRPSTMTVELHGKENLDAIQIYNKELKQYLSKLEQLCQDAELGEKSQAILYHIKLNLLFPFEIRESREEKLDDQPSDIFIDIKRKLEIIYVILDKKLKSNGNSFKEDVRAILTIMAHDLGECGKGFHSILTEIIENEKQARSSVIDISQIVATCRTEAVRLLAADHIREHSLHVSLHTHVELYYFTIAENQLFHTNQSELEKKFQDPYFGDIINRIKHFGNPNGEPQFRNNQLQARISDIYNFTAYIQKYYNEKSLVLSINHHLEDKIKKLYHQYLERFPHNEDNDLWLVREIEKTLSQQKISESMLNAHHILGSFFKPAHDKSLARELVDPQLLAHALSQFSIAILEAQGFFIRRALSIHTTKTHINDNFNINIHVISAHALDPDDILLPNNIVTDFFDSKGIVLSLQDFIDNEYYKSDEQRNKLLSAIFTPIHIKQLIEIINVALLEPDEDRDQEDRKILCKFSEEATSKIIKLNQLINTKIINSINKNDYNYKYGLPLLSDLQVTEQFDFYSLLTHLSSQLGKDTLSKHFDDIPGLMSFIKQCFLSNIQHFKSLAHILMFYICEIIQESSLNIKAREHQYEKLARLFDSIYMHIEPKSIANPLKPYLSDKVAIHFLTNKPVARSFYLLNANILLITRARTLAHILSLGWLDIDNTILNHKNQIKRTDNLSFIRHSNVHSDFDSGLFIESVEDIIEVLSLDRDLYVYRHDFDPIEKLIECVHFNQHFNTGRTHILFQIGSIAQDFEERNPSIKPYQKIMLKLFEKTQKDPEALKAILKNMQLKNWGSFLSKMGLLSPEHDFTWVHSPNLGERMIGLLALLAIDVSLERNEAQRPVSPSLITPGMSTTRSARLRPYVEAQQAVYEPNKVIDLLAAHYIDRFRTSNLTQSLAVIPEEEEEIDSPMTRIPSPH